MEIKFDYKPHSWQIKYHSSAMRHCALSGGLGSGKSTAAVNEHLTLALEHPGSLWLIGRKTLPSLKDTILRTFMSVCPPEIIKPDGFNKTNLTCKLVNDSEFIFRPLDDPEKLKSLEIAGFIIEEANEVDEDIYNRLKDRMRQKLPSGLRPRYRSTIMLNPTEEDHWIPQVFLFKKPPLHELFQSTTFDNLQNLPEDYIKELQSMYSDDVQQRLIFGQFGKVHKGRPVYPQFSNGNHIASFGINPKLPVIRSWDFGFRHPAVIWAQQDGSQVRIFAEMMGDKVYLEDFIKHHVFPWEHANIGRSTAEHPIRFLDFCDPRGSDQSDKGHTSVGILRDNGIFPVFRRTWIEEGIKAIKSKLDSKDASGLSNFLIHPRCKILIEGLRGGYAREDGAEMPRKDGYYEHLCDTLRYLVIHLVQRRKIDSYNERQSENKVYVNPHTGRRIEL